MLNARAAGSIPASVTTNRIFHSVFSTVMLAGVAWRHTGSGRFRAHCGHADGHRVRAWHRRLDALRTDRDGHHGGPNTLGGVMRQSNQSRRLDRPVERRCPQRLPPSFLPRTLLVEAATRGRRRLLAKARNPSSGLVTRACLALTGARRGGRTLRRRALTI
jgi:hypothetical protein